MADTIWYLLKIVTSCYKLVFIGFAAIIKISDSDLKQNSQDVKMECGPQKGQDEKM